MVQPIQYRLGHDRVKNTNSSARGFGPDDNGGVEGQPYTPTSEDQIT
jgi:hypothetical protein